MKYEEKYKELVALSHSNDSKIKEKADAWQTAIGLQDVDGLKVSPYLLDTARTIPDKPNDPNQKCRKKQ